MQTIKNGITTNVLVQRIKSLFQSKSGTGITHAQHYNYQTNHKKD